MKPLTKDEPFDPLKISYNINAKMVSVGEILKWKEDADKFGWAIRKLKQLRRKNKRLTESLRNPEYEYGYTHVKNKDWNEIKKKIEIEKRLKNQYKWFEEFADNDSDWHSIQVRDLLQKILENKE